MSEKKPLLRKDYRPLDFYIPETYLDIAIASPLTTVKSKLQFKRLNDQATSVTLNGRKLELLSVKVNGEEFKDYKLVQHEGREGFQDLVLDLSALANLDEFTLEVENRFDLDNNLTLGGIYKAGEHVCSQCEAESFRQITFYLDRPDNLSVFTVRITANKEQYPYLLSNGNLVSEGDLEDGLHYAIWNDPFPKPCYLFACVAGKFDLVEDKFTTMSGRDVDIRIFAEVSKGHLLHFAMESIKRAMRWDEERFGLEYDLDLFMIVAVSFFNMGAMENKGLNIFNDALLIGDQDTASDSRLKAIDKVIAHEYFHNWTGDRVTCRDWFQLTLKEGLTVFRDQEYTSDVLDRTIERLESVNVIKFAQFDEDQGPLSHPIRPEAVKTQDNFYTVTVYDKGSEVIRMIHTLIGEENFQKGMKLYFQRHDGKAVTCDDFVDAMQDASGVDLTDFRKWYSQSGTPIVVVKTEHNPEAKTFSLKLTQINNPTNNQAEKEPLVLPLKTEYFTVGGKKLTDLVTVSGEPAPELIILDSAEKTLEFKDVAENLVIATNLDFSAPVKVQADYSLAELELICLNSEDPYTQSNAVQKVYEEVYRMNLANLEAGKELEVPVELVKLYRHLLNVSTTNPSFYAMQLGFTAPRQMGSAFDKDLQPLKLVEIYKFVTKYLAAEFKDLALEIYNKLPKFTKWEYTNEQFGTRDLASALLSLITKDKSHKELVVERYNQAICLSDRLMALRATILNGLELTELTDDFQERYRDYPNVLDDYIGMSIGAATNLEQVKAMTKHFNYDPTNPNRVRAVMRPLASNYAVMYNEDGKSLEWLADEIVRIDEFNPQLASGLTILLTNFYKFAEPFKGLIFAQIERLNANSNLSGNVKELVGQAVQMGANLAK